jgi:hypothetical protein
MKKLFFIFLGAMAFSSCNNQSSDSTEATTDSSAKVAATEKVNYPYTIDHPDYWNIGSPENTMVALSALKAYENGNIPETLKYFGDSVHLQFDGLDKTIAADTLRLIFTNNRKMYKTYSIKMDDWESVISKNKKEEWVTLWYRQKWEDMNGSKDSLDVIDDLKLKDGKIIRLDEYTRKLH